MLGEYDILKIKAVLLYIIINSNQDRHNVYSIVKMAYYTRQMHYAEWGHPIFNDKIAALPFGPVPSTIYNILRISRGDSMDRRFCEGDNLHIVSDAIQFDMESFSAKEKVDMDYLSNSNIVCLDEAIRKVSAMSFSEIVEDTHGEEWKRVYNDSNLHYMDYVNIAKEAGASDAMVEYIEDQMEIDEMLS